MLIRIDNKTVRGPVFFVRVPDIHHVQYEEDGRVASVEIEGGLGPGGGVDWLVYSETLRGWDSPSERQEMSISKRHEILGNISKSLDLLGMPHQVV